MRRVRGGRHVERIEYAFLDEILEGFLGVGGDDLSTKEVKLRVVRVVHVVSVRSETGTMTTYNARVIPLFPQFEAGFYIPKSLRYSDRRIVTSVDKLVARK